jgi:hypothetical protein
MLIKNYCSSTVLQKIQEERGDVILRLFFIIKHRIYANLSRVFLSFVVGAAYTQILLNTNNGIELFKSANSIA